MPKFVSRAYRVVFYGNICQNLRRDDVAEMQHELLWHHPSVSVVSQVTIFFPSTK